MYKYQISRVLEVFDGQSFEAIVDLGMGVYLKRTIILDKIHSPSPDSQNSVEKEYGVVAKDKLSYYLRKKPIHVMVIEYDNDKIYGEVYNEEFEDSINHIMFIKGYVWSKKENDDKYETWILNYPRRI